MAETVPDSAVHAPERQRPLPGMLVLFGEGKPLYHPIVLRPGVTMTLGRHGFGGLTLTDQKMSTRHAEVSWDGAFTITDLSSTNGTFLDGARLLGKRTVEDSAVLRMGQTLVLLVSDVSAFISGEVSTERGTVVGPSMKAVLDKVTLARREGASLLIHGETGAGKELVARTFHEASPRPGPLVAFNCANFEPGLAGARLFGTVPGAFTGAVESQGLFLQAHGGVLFLDEIAELDLDVQAMLLRTLETGTVQRVGEKSVKQVNVAVVVASHHRLRDRVDAGRFRRDLMFRLNQFEVQLPPLRARREEIPWLMQLALEGRGQPLNALFVEAALLRPWPGNVRELLNAVRVASAMAQARGGPIEVRDLPELAGLAPEPPAAVAPARSRPQDHSKESVLHALTECGWNVTRAAEKLGLHRTQLNRLIDTFELKRPAK